MEDMLPTDELKNEHRVIERMMKLLWDASNRLERGNEIDPEFFVNAGDFFSNFADKCHHAKEEKLLFEKMMERGVPRDVGPIPVMLSEHTDGRMHVRKITELAGKKLGPKELAQLVENGRDYVSMLTKHIQKEDSILYPMANDVLTARDQRELEEGFDKIEKEIMGPGVHERYHKMIEAWEKRLGTHI
jgi:hemerythrin-like domain-containing protein